MTQLEFDNYKLQIQYIISEKTEKIANYLAIGKANICNDMTNLRLLIAYMEIIETYTLEAIAVTDDLTTNFFTRDEMQSIVTHINKICNTHYNVDFIF
jgi:hypothetical protein